MDALAKLLQKSTEKDKIFILGMLRDLQDPTLRSTFDIVKLSGGSFYRARKGAIRFIFHFELDRVIIDAVRGRNEKTYRGF